jgi:hypothetical protein
MTFAPVSSGCPIGLAAGAIHVGLEAALAPADAPLVGELAWLESPMNLDLL